MSISAETLSIKSDFCEELDNFKRTAQLRNEERDLRQRTTALRQQADELWQPAAELHQQADKLRQQATQLETQIRELGFTFKFPAPEGYRVVIDSDSSNAPLEAEIFGIFATYTAPTGYVWQAYPEVGRDDPYIMIDQSNPSRQRFPAHHLEYEPKDGNVYAYSENGGVRVRWTEEVNVSVESIE